MESDPKISAVPIEQICQTIMFGTVLDVFLLIVKEPDISKAEMSTRFVEAVGGGKASRFRTTVREGVAKLEGALFVEFWSDGVHQRYRLTPFGKIAQIMVADLVMQEDAESRIRTSIITKQVLLEDEEEKERA